MSRNQPEPPRYLKITAEQKSAGWMTFPGTYPHEFSVVNALGGGEYIVLNPEWLVWRRLQDRCPTGPLATTSVDS